MLSSLIRLAICLPLALSLTACMAPSRAVDALPSDANLSTRELTETRDNLTPRTAPRAARILSPQPQVTQFTGLGMSQVSTQPGKTLNEKRLMAIRAARMEALRDLTEQVHGIRLTSETTLRDQVLRSDYVRGIVEGEIRGARTLRITPKDGDSFEVVLTLSPDVVRYIMRAVGRA
jgi:hypothetical protein